MELAHEILEWMEVETGTSIRNLETHAMDKEQSASRDRLIALIESWSSKWEAGLRAELDLANQQYENAFKHGAQLRAESDRDKALRLMLIDERDSARAGVEALREGISAIAAMLVDETTGEIGRRGALNTALALLAAKGENDGQH